MSISYVLSDCDNDVTMAIGDVTSCIRIRRTKVADVGRRLCDCGGVLARAQELSKLIASRVLADFIDGECMAASVYLKSYLPPFDNRHFFRREMVILVRARVG